MVPASESYGLRGMLFLRYTFVLQCLEAGQVDLVQRFLEIAELSRVAGHLDRETVRHHYGVFAGARVVPLFMHDTSVLAIGLAVAVVGRRIVFDGRPARECHQTL